MFSKCVLLAVFVTVACARSTATSQNAIPEETPRSEESASYMGDLRYMYKVYQECAATDLSSCLKLKLVTAMDRVARNYAEVPIIDGVNFIRSNDVPNEEIKSEAEIEASLPRALTERETTLNNLIFDKIATFFETHTLQVKLPTASELQRSLSEEGRGKKKKMSGLLLIPLILGGTLVPLALGALALLAGKALIVSKLALVLAGIIGLKKLLSGSGSSHHDSGHEVYLGGHGSGYARSYVKEDAQNVAYNAYAPKQR
ncbi:hypothetical protein MML48_5g00002974 [Holotrichia oblita]|uniref:Uncharacterized protein n=1 Tax=Holotrichia oblita TaxID=644536 RepID=A0ACB9T4H4_HOLOL|nr:hypothetical protein MML48_5g00002974 [Holotrichia oblita]